MHVCSQAVLVTVCFMTNRTQHLGGSTVQVVITRNVNIETVLILHFSVAVITAEPVIMRGLTSDHVTEHMCVKRQGQVSNSTHPTCCSCNTEQT